MLIRPFLLVFIACLLGSCGDAGFSPSGKSLQDATANTLPYDGYFYTLSKKGKFNGSVLVALPDTVFEQSYRIENAPERMKVSSNLRYPIGEVSHLLIRAAYFKMADQGRITLNGPVSDFLPKLPQHNAINYRMILDHRAGLPEVLPKGQSLSDIVYRCTPGTVLDLNAPPGNFAVGFSDAGGFIAEVPISEFPTTIIPEFYSTITDLFYLSQWMPESAFLKGELRQPGVRPGYRSYFYASLEVDKTQVVLGNFGGIALREVVGGL